MKEMGRISPKKRTDGPFEGAPMGLAIVNVARLLGLWKPLFAYLEKMFVTELPNEPYTW